MKKYALITDDNTAISETGICHACKVLHGTDKIIMPDDAKDRVFVDCTGNDAVMCNYCKRK